MFAEYITRFRLYFSFRASYHSSFISFTARLGRVDKMRLGRKAIAGPRLNHLSRIFPFHEDFIHPKRIPFSRNAPSDDWQSFWNSTSLKLIISLKFAHLGIPSASAAIQISSGYDWKWCRGFVRLNSEFDLSTG